MFQPKNTLLDGSTITEQMYMSPKDCEDLFESIEKPKEVIAAPRSTFIRAGVLTTVRGSAYIEYGNTKMLAVVAPPHEMIRSSARRVNMGVINCYVNFAAFATSELDTVSEREKHLGSTLTKALEPLVCRNEFLNFQLDIRVLILDDDGCLLSTAITCCGIALVECGISTYDLIAASTVCIYRDFVFVNPSAKIEELLRHNNNQVSSNETTRDHGMLVIGSMDTFEQLAQCQQSGYLTPETYVRLLDYALEINRKLRELITHELTSRVKEQHVLDVREQQESAREDERLAAIIERLKQQGLNEFIQPSSSSSSNIKEDPFCKK